ncbi:MAG: hypothetical protein ACI9G5_003035 [Paracoccaceae bacterium]|jgi:hypothetical protein
MTAFIASLAAAIGFIGDFHPIVVHFPLALLPTALLLKLYNWRRPSIGGDRIVITLLTLAFSFAALAVLLGATTRSVNGFSSAGVDHHAIFGLVTLCALGLSLYLHLCADSAGRLLFRLRPWARSLLNGTWRFLVLSIRVLKWLVMLLLFPVVLLFWLLQIIARRIGPFMRTIAAVRRRFSAMWTSTKQLLRRLGSWFSARFTRMLTSVPAWQNASLLACLVLIGTTGLLGADLSHGEGHLTRNMPPALQALLGADNHGEANLQLDRAYFEQEVLPVFRRSCVKCHGEEKQKAGLRLDNYAALVESRVVRYQQPYNSELLKRLLLSRDNPAAMPPQGKSREVHPEDFSRIINWLQGHSLESLAQQSGGMPEALKQLASRMPAVGDEDLAALAEIEGLRIHRLVQNYDLLVVNLAYVAPSKLPEASLRIAAVAENIVDISFTGLQLDNEQWQALAGMRNLQRLNLRNSNAGNSDLKMMESLHRLEWLNLFGSAVDIDEKALKLLLPSLQHVYLSSPETLAID